MWLLTFGDSELESESHLGIPRVLEDRLVSCFGAEVKGNIVMGSNSPL